MNEYMDMAFLEAENAFKENEVPVGAVLVYDNQIVFKSHNSKEFNNCVLNHAEINVIEGYSKIINNWRLDECELYITKDPCPMCASAIKQARISKVFSAVETDSENTDIINRIFNSDDSNKKVIFVTNLDVKRGKKILSDFFKNKR